MLSPAACEPIARRTEAASDQRYGLRKPSRRTKVRRCGTVAGSGGFVGAITCLNAESSHALPVLRRICRRCCFTARHIRALHGDTLNAEGGPRRPRARPLVSFAGATAARVGPEHLGGARRGGARGSARSD